MKKEEEIKEEEKREFREEKRKKKRQLRRFHEKSRTLFRYAAGYYLVHVTNRSTKTT